MGAPKKNVNKKSVMLEFLQEVRVNELRYVERLKVNYKIIDVAAVKICHLRRTWICISHQLDRSCNYLNF
jgi:hypothetical protein